MTVNGENLGIYSNVESVKSAFIQRSFGDSTGLLYEGTVTDFFEDGINRFEAKNKPANREPLLALARTLDDDDMGLEELGELVDIDAFIKFWATESLIGFWDGYNNDQNNFFVYQNPKNSKLYFIPWGIDCAFAENMPIPPFIVRPQFVYMQSRLSNRLYRNEETRDKYHAQLQQLLNEKWNEEALYAKLDALEERVESFNIREKESEKSLKRIRRFIKVRRDKLTKEIEKGFTPKPARIPPYADIAVKAKGTFDAKWRKDDPKESKLLGSHELDLEYRGETIKFREMGVYAKQKEDKGKKRDAANIILHGKRSNGKEMTLALELPFDRFKATDGESISVGGVLIDGKFGWFGTSYKRLSGVITLDEADREIDAQVKGSFEVTGLEFVDPNRQKKK